MLAGVLMMWSPWGWILEARRASGEGPGAAAGARRPGVVVLRGLVSGALEVSIRGTPVGIVLNGLMSAKFCKQADRHGKQSPRWPGLCRFIFT